MSELQLGLSLRMLVAMSTLTHAHARHTSRAAPPPPCAESTMSPPTQRWSASSWPRLTHLGGTAARAQARQAVRGPAACGSCWLTGTLPPRSRPCADDLGQHFPYAQGVWKEALRLVPPGAGIARGSRGGLELGGYRVPPNITLQVCIYAMHRDPKHWRDPDAFEPERWVPGSPHYVGANPSAYMPFGDVRSAARAYLERNPRAPTAHPHPPLPLPPTRRAGRAQVRWISLRLVGGCDHAHRPVFHPYLQAAPRPVAAKPEDDPHFGSSGGRARYRAPPRVSEHACPASRCPLRARDRADSSHFAVTLAAPPLPSLSLPLAAPPSPPVSVNFAE